MPFVGKLEVVDDLPHPFHRRDHPARLRHRAPRIVGPAREEDGHANPVEVVDRRELAVQVRVGLGVSHLLAVVAA